MADSTLDLERFAQQLECVYPFVSRIVAILTTAAVAAIPFALLFAAEPVLALGLAFGVLAAALLLAFMTALHGRIPGLGIPAIAGGLVGIVFLQT